jgi:hypothetical protein
VRLGAGNIIFQSLGGPNSGQKGSILFLEYFFFLGGGDAAKLRWREGAQRPVWRVTEPKKTGARSARARTRGQNPLVVNIQTDICSTVPFFKIDEPFFLFWYIFIGVSSILRVHFVPSLVHGFWGQASNQGSALRQAGYNYHLAMPHPTFFAHSLISNPLERFRVRHCVKLKKEFFCWIRFFEEKT